MELHSFFLFSLLFLVPIDAQKYAADLSVPTTPDQLQCLQTAKYSTLFVRTFKPDGKNGTVDSDGIQTIQTIRKVWIQIETGVFMEPQGGSQNGGQQLDTMYQALNNAGISFRRLWIQVTASDHWNADPALNVDLINSIIRRANQYGLLIGIFTSMADWQTVTDNVKTLASSHVDLWYSNVYWQGTTGETTPDFDDFVAFGPFNKSSVLVKQYGQSELFCGLTLNNDVYFN